MTKLYKHNPWLEYGTYETKEDFHKAVDQYNADMEALQKAYLRKGKWHLFWGIFGIALINLLVWSPELYGWLTR